MDSYYHYCSFLDACAKDSTDETLESKMIGLSKKMKEAKEMVEEEENFDIKIIQVWAHMNRMPKTGNTPDIYIAKELLEGIKIQNSDLENLTANKLSRTLRKLGIIRNKTDKPLKDNQRCYKLTEDRIRRSAKRNGIPLLDDLIFLRQKKVRILILEKNRLGKV